VAVRLKIDDPLSFSDEESFGLFMEGLRALQLYEDEALKEQPTRKNLRRWMEDALDSLRDCISHYPVDLLPRFYLGVALSMRNQEVYVARLQQVSSACVAAGRYLAYRDMSHDPEFPSLDREFAIQRAGEESEVARPYWELGHRPWPLLKEASDFFQSLLSAPNIGLQRVAAYNLAQIYGRRGPEFLEQGINVLDAAEAKPTSESAHNKDQATATKRLNFLDSLNLLFSSTPDRKSEERVRLEDTALDVQFACLRESFKVRLSARDTASAPNNFKEIYAKFKAVGDRIEMAADIDDPAYKRDLQADFLTKLGYVDYERALNPALTSPSLTATDCLEQASASFLTALEQKEHWNPAQIYLATVRRIQSGVAEAFLQHAHWHLRTAQSERRELLERERNNFQELQKQMTKEADELFANLQGLPFPVIASPNSYSDG
jgi:hypothetical protein